MLKKLLQHVGAFVIVMLAFAMLSLPAIGFTYLLAWLLSYLFDINFDSAITHGVLLVLAAIWTLATINSKEGSEELSNMLTLKR